MEEMINSLLDEFQDGEDRICNLQLDLISDHLLHRGGNQIIFMFRSGSSFHLLLINSLTVAVCIFDLASVQIVSRVLVDVTSILPFVGLLLKADTFQIVADCRMPSRFKCKEVCSKRERIYIVSCCTLTQYVRFEVE